MPHLALQCASVTIPHSPCEYPVTSVFTAYYVVHCPASSTGSELAGWFGVKVAIPTWTGRISPVFDVAKRLLIVEFQGNGEVSREETPIEETHVSARAQRVTQLGVNVLICGAISMPLEATLVSAGVRVIPFTCGSVGEILRAFASGQLTDEMFLMPGCCGRRRRFHGRHRNGRAGLNVQGDSR